MEQRRLRLGDILDDYCPRERRVTNHVVVAMIEDEIKQTRCSTCDAEHPYKGGKAPRRRKPEQRRGRTSRDRRPTTPPTPTQNQNPISRQNTFASTSRRRWCTPTPCRNRAQKMHRSMKGRSIVLSSARRCRGPKGSRRNGRCRNSRFARTVLVGTATISAAALPPRDAAPRAWAVVAAATAPDSVAVRRGVAVRDAAVSRPAASIAARRSAPADRPSNPPSPGAGSLTSTPTGRDRPCACAIPDFRYTTRMQMQGKHGLIVGVANKRSISWAIARAAGAAGARWP